MKNQRNQIGWSVRARWAMVGLMIFSTGMFYLTWWRPAQRIQDGLRTAIDHTQADLQQAKSQLANLPALKADVYRLQAEVEPFSRLLPLKVEISPFMKEIGNLCQQTAVRKFTWQPGTIHKLDGLSELPVTMNFEGDFYSVYDFLKQAEDMPRLTRVRSLMIRTKDAKLGQVEVQMAMSLYYAD
jgi:type IV pilus assembly protein PilO